MPRIKFLQTLLHKRCDVEVREVSLGFIKDAIITQLQSLPTHNKEIEDIFIGDLPDPLPMKIYTRKEVRKKK